MSSIKNIVRAINFSCIRHSTQRRKDSAKTPYINHPIGVMNILCEEGDVTDVDVLIGAVLHDTVEDTDTTIEEIQEEFGAHIAQIVSEVTDDKSLPKAERKRLQVVNAPHKSHQAKLIKLADKLYNIRDLTRETPDGWTDDRVQEYYSWASRVCSNLVGTNPQLENAIKIVLEKNNVSFPCDSPI